MTILSFDILSTALVIGVSSGIIGAFIILRRMALVGDAMSHVALPGIALMLAYEIDPFWGVLIFLLAAAVIVWWLEKTTKLYSEALIGVLFTLSLAVGILTIPDHEVLESLFGGFSPLSPLVLGVVLTAGILLTAFTVFLTRPFLFAIVSPELAAAENKKRTSWFELLLFLMLSFAVALGIKLVGTILMGALTIIPASIAKNVSQSMASYVTISSVLGGLIALGGVIIASQLSFAPGPIVIILGVALFVCSIFFVRKT